MSKAKIRDIIADIVDDEVKFEFLFCYCIVDCIDRTHSISLDGLQNKNNNALNNAIHKF
jgi:hypothetical protein